MRYALLFLPMVLAGFPGCGGGDEAPPGGALEPVEIRLEARVGDAPFACGTEYAAVGADGATATPTDFRFFVHDVRLVGADGRETPLELVDDGQWQGRGVALLDFEDATGGCDTGFTTPEVNTTLRGRAPRGTYTGVRLRVGVPAELNHADPTAMPAPLNTTQLTWTWNFGYIFLAATAKVMGETPFDQGVHLGSRGCAGDAKDGGETVACQYPNRPEVELANVDLGGPIVVDWGAIFSALPMKQPSDKCQAPHGGGHGAAVNCVCHTSGPDDRCPALFAPFGVDWASGSVDPQTQGVFRGP
jgi:uncharacterized repeat protein (TIGR04052 family)